MLKKLVKPNSKKIKKARVVYETYCKVNTLARTREATGLAIDTIRRYIALVEDIDNKSKLSTKDRYYNNKDNNIYNNIYRDTKDINNNIKDINNNNEDKIDNGKDNSKNSVEVINTTNVPSLKEVKNKILISKLNTISLKYLGYLDDPDIKKLNRTSLKDRAVIAGILLDKKILLEHKQADVIKNQSIIFNLFGNNKNLASFISGALTRQKKLGDRSPKKYEQEATNQ